MSKKQVLCGLGVLGTIVGVITILVVIVYLAVRNGTEKEPVFQIDIELKMDGTEKTTIAENTPKPGNTPNPGNTQKPGNTPKPPEIHGVTVSTCQMRVFK